jgi:hypothetical protein
MLDVRETGYVRGKWTDMLQDKNKGASQYRETHTYFFFLSTLCLTLVDHTE